LEKVRSDFSSLRARGALYFLQLRATAESPTQANISFSHSQSLSEGRSDLRGEKKKYLRRGTPN